MQVHILERNYKKRPRRFFLFIFSMIYDYKITKLYHLQVCGGIRIYFFKLRAGNNIIHYFTNAKGSD